MLESSLGSGWSILDMCTNPRSLLFLYKSHETSPMKMTVAATATPIPACAPVANPECEVDFWPADARLVDAGLVGVEDG
jgi:hypothetical protein